MLSFSAEMTKEEENNGEIKVNEAKQTILLYFQRLKGKKGFYVFLSIYQTT